MLFIFCFKNLQFSWKMLIFAIGKFYQPLLMTLSISIQVGASCANLLFSLRIGSVSVGVRGVAMAVGRVQILLTNSCLRMAVAARR